jgi:hypothetical protein
MAPSNQSQAMSRFDEHSKGLIALVGEGLSEHDACEQLGLPYSTARKWVNAGRRDPAGRYGNFVKALNAARASTPGDEAPGPVAQNLEALIANRELDSEKQLGLAQARALARSIDTLSRSKAGAAALGLVAASKRLEDVVHTLRVRPPDAVDRIAARRSAAIQAANGSRS